MDSQDKEKAKAAQVFRVEMPTYGGYPNLEPLSIDDRIQTFSCWLESCGVSPENMLTEYLNELVRISVERHGLNGSVLLVGQLKEQATELFQQLYIANMTAFDLRGATKKTQK